MSTGIGPEHCDALRRYKRDCEDNFEFVGLLSYEGDKNRLPRDNCFIGRSTLDAASARKERERRKSKGTDGADADCAQAVERLKDEQLIDRIRRGKLKRVFITGEGGIGKTEYTRLIAYRLAKSLDVDHPLAVPLRFDLKELTLAFDNGEEFFQRRLAPTSHLWLTPLADEGEVVFIFDGLDEVGIDRFDFNRIFKTLIERFPKCSFVLAGRPGLLGNLDYLFPDPANHELRPLELCEIQCYVNGYFVHRNRPDLAPRLMAEIQSNIGSLFPVIQSPFMLSVACDGYFDDDEPNEPLPHALPSNPAELIELWLRRFFRWHREGRGGSKSILPKSDDICLEALSTLAAFMLVAPKLGELFRLTFSAEEGEKWLLRSSAIFEAADANYPLLHDGHAKELLDSLTPHSGILARTGNRKFEFSNRVIAEFLAAQWIARHGYPNWPYDFDDPILQYTKPVTKPETREQRRDRQIMDFLGDHVWSIDRSGLVQAVCFELGRTRDGRTLLMRFVHWMRKQIELFYTGHPTDLDIRSTLAVRIFHTFRALHDTDGRECLTEIVACAHWLIPAAEGWWKLHVADFTLEAIQSLPTSCKAEYLGHLSAALHSFQRWDSHAIVYLADVIASIAADVKLKEHARDALAEALEWASKRPEKNWSEVACVADAIASGFAADAKLKGRARDALLAALEAASKDPTEEWGEIRDLADAVASGFTADAELNERARDALSAVLDAAGLAASDVAEFASAIPSGFAADAMLMKRARDALACVLEAISKSPGINGHLIAAVASAIAANFESDATLKKRASDALAAVLESARKEFERCVRSRTKLLMVKDDPNTSCTLINVLASAIASGFEGEVKLNERALVALSAALDAASRDPKNYWRVFGDLVAAVASSFGSDAKLKKRARDALAAAMERVSRNPEINGGEIAIVAGAIASSFGSDAHLKKRVRDALSAALDAARKDPSENWSSIINLARTIVSGFAADGELKERACDALVEAMDARIRGSKENSYSIGELASAIASGFAADAELKERARDALLTAMDAGSRETAHAIASGFAGDLTVAAAVIRAGNGMVLNSEKWRPFVTVRGDWKALRQWAGLRGERWGLSSGEPIIEKLRVHDSDSSESNLAVLVVPREKIRRGLSAELLATIVAEESPSLGPDLATNSSASPEAAGPNGSKHDGSTVESVATPASVPVATRRNEVEPGADSVAVSEAIKRMLQEKTIDGSRMGSSPIESSDAFDRNKIGIEWFYQEEVCENFFSGYNSGQLSRLIKRYGLNPVKYNNKNYLHIDTIHRLRGKMLIAREDKDRRADARDQRNSRE